jgi:hypothetical protein
MGDLVYPARLQKIHTMNRLLLDYYRCPEEYGNFALTGRLSRDSHYFLFGLDTICYGQSVSDSHIQPSRDGLYDALVDVTLTDSEPRLPFDPVQVIDNLRLERYVLNDQQDRRNLSEWKAIKRIYYYLRPMLPTILRHQAQRMYFKDWKKISFPCWPVDRTVDRMLEKLLVLSFKARSVNRIPFIWFWPDGAQSCAIMTHDVETVRGRDFCSRLMDLDDAVGIKASFQIVPENRYQVSENLLDTIRERGFEINVQDLNHDGCLFDSHDQFLRRAERINYYGRKYGARGFRSAVLYRKVDWYGALDFSYDMSIPTVAHLEAQRGGCCTLMPFFVGEMVELPLTTTQDYSLFHILQDYSTSVWKKQVSLIEENHGLASFLVHPDYLLDKRAQDTYKALLECLAQLRDDRKMWIALPREVDKWWRLRSQMRLTCQGGTWQIEGVGKEHARIAHACIENDQIIYNFE